MALSAKTVGKFDRHRLESHAIERCVRGVIVMPDYGAWIGVTSKDQLQGVRPDPNPFIDCENCGESYKYQDYWEERYVKDIGAPSELAWFCDECLEQFYEQYKRVKRRENHRTLGEWST